MDFKTLKTKSKESLLKELDEARTQKKALEFSVSANQLKNVREIRKTKKMIAHMLTVLKMKEKMID